MSDHISVQNYKKMMDQLKIFASDVSKLASNMKVSADLCKKALNENDKSIGKICGELTQAQMEYLKVAKKALLVVQKMQDELDEASKENPLWND